MAMAIEGPLAAAPDPGRSVTAGGGVRHLGLRAYLTGSGVWPLVIVVVVGAVFAPVVITEYAGYDDFSFLWMALSGEPSTQFGDGVLVHFAANGRPLSGVFVRLTFGLAETIDHLRYVRMAGVAGVAFFGLLLQWNLIRAGLPRMAAGLTAIFICSMPSFVVYTSWSVLFVAPYAAILAGAASMETVRGAEGAETPRWEALAGATGLLLVATWLYQPPAMFYWVFLVVALVPLVDDPRRAWRVVRAHLGVGAASLGLSYLSIRLSVWLFDLNTPDGWRRELSHDVPGRLQWFAEQPLYQALNLFDLTPTKSGAALMVLVATAGVLLWVTMQGRVPWAYAVLGLALVPLSYLPNLVVVETWSPFRTQSALAGLLALYAALGALGLWALVGEGLRTRVNSGASRAWIAAGWGGAIVVVAVSCLVTYSNLNELVVHPLNLELRIFRSQVRAVPAEPPRVSFVHTAMLEGMTKEWRYDEIGLPFTARAWAPGPTIQLLLREDGRLTSTYRGPEVDYYPSSTGQFPAGQPLIDLRWIRRLR